jgi:hypothetical protein
MRGLYNPLKKPTCPAAPASSNSGRLGMEHVAPQVVQNATRASI